MQLKSKCDAQDQTIETDQKSLEWVPLAANDGYRGKIIKGYSIFVSCINKEDCKFVGVNLFNRLQPKKEQRTRLKLSAPTVRDIAMSPDKRKGIWPTKSTKASANLCLLHICKNLGVAPLTPPTGYFSSQ